MKDLKDYTNEDLSVLTEVEIENLIDVECMKAGVSLSIAPKPVLKEVPEIKEPTTEIFQVDNYYFTDSNESAQLAAVLSSMTSRVSLDYNYNSGSSNNKYYKKYETSTDIKKSRAYSKEEYNELTDLLKARKDIEDYNREVTKEYNDSLSGRREVVNEVWDAIRDAQNEMRKINEALNIYKKYVELSDGDEDIAKKFFSQNDKVSEYMDVVLKKYSK
jgi:flagellar hook-basal body complex protein FliE